MYGDCIGYANFFNLFLHFVCNCKQYVLYLLHTITQNNIIMTRKEIKTLIAKLEEQLYTACHPGKIGCLEDRIEALKNIIK